MKNIVIFSTLLVLIDQITKSLMTNRSYFSGFLQLNYVTNKGAAFGMFPGWRWVFIVISVIVIFGIFYYAQRYKYQAGLVFLLGGTVGNLIDRLFFGYVRDFISVRYFSTFNLADAFGVIGVTLIVFYSWKYSKDRLKKKEKKSKK